MRPPVTPAENPPDTARGATALLAETGPNSTMQTATPTRARTRTQAGAEASSAPAPEFGGRRWRGAACCSFLVEEKRL